MTVESVNADARGIYLRGSTYWLNFQTKGVRRFVSLDTSDFSEAIAAAREIRMRGVRNQSSGFMDEIERFLAYKRRKNEFTATSAGARFYILRAFANWVDVPPGAVTSRQVQAWYDENVNGHGATTANGYAMIARSFFKWALENRRITDRNPCDGLELAREQHAGLRFRDFCTAEQRDRLIKTCKREDLRFVLFCGFHAGLRKNEIIEARPWWFDLGAGLLHLRSTTTFAFKDRRERTIPITKDFLRFLKRYGLREPYMLRPETKHGQNRYRYDFSRPFFEHTKAQGLEKVGQTRVTPHLMRHTFASLLASAGVSLYKIAVWLGDNPRVVEEHYARLNPKDPDIERAFH